jgi:hypothetical protein
MECMLQALLANVTSATCLYLLVAASATPTVTVFQVWSAGEHFTM